MASKTIFTIAFPATNPRDLWPLEKVLKKSFAPSEFEIIAARIPLMPEVKRMREEVGDAKEDGSYPIHLPDFERLETWGLLMLKEHATADVVVAYESDYSPSTLGKGVMSHYRIRALLLDRLSRHDDSKPFWSHIHPWVSELTMPYLGGTGSTPEQRERGMKTILRGVIEGWKAQSPRYPGVLQNMGYRFTA